MTLEDVCTTLMQQNMIFIRDATPPLVRPSPGQSIRYPKGRKNGGGGVSRRHTARNVGVQALQATPDANGERGPFCATCTLRNPIRPRTSSNVHARVGGEGVPPLEAGEAAVDAICCRADGGGAAFCTSGDDERERACTCGSPMGERCARGGATATPAAPATPMVVDSVLDTPGDMVVDSPERPVSPQPSPEPVTPAPRRTRSGQVAAEATTPRRVRRPKMVVEEVVEAVEEGPEPDPEPEPAPEPEREPEREPEEGRRLRSGRTDAKRPGSAREPSGRKRRRVGSTPEPVAVDAVKEEFVYHGAVHAESDLRSTLVESGSEDAEGSVDESMWCSLGLFVVYRAKHASQTTWSGWDGRCKVSCPRSSSPASTHRMR